MKARGTIFRLVFAGAAVTLLVHIVPLAELQSALGQVALSGLIAGILLQMLARLLTGWRMTLLARYQGLPLDFRTMLSILFSASFYTFLLPGAVLGGAATYVKYRQHGGEAAASLGNIVANKGLEVLATLWLGALALAWTRFGEIALMGVGVGLLVFMATAHSLLRAGGWIQHWQARGSASPRPLVRKLGALLDALNVFERLSASQTRRLLMAALLAQTVPIAAMFTFAWGLGLSINVIDVAWVYTAVFLLAILPLTVANVGVREITMIALLLPLGVTAAEATAWSLCLYLGPLLAACLGLLLEIRSGGGAAHCSARGGPNAAP